MDNPPVSNAMETCFLHCEVEPSAGALVARLVRAASVGGTRMMFDEEMSVFLNSPLFGLASTRNFAPLASVVAGL